MIEITKETISPEQVVNSAKTNSSGCVVTYVGVIRDSLSGQTGSFCRVSGLQGKCRESDCKKSLTKPDRSGK